MIANPPYSAQQDSENDNNQNFEYPSLDQRIRTTYAAGSNSKLQKNLYDSYVRAIRWATDRIAERGVIGLVTNGSFIDANNMDSLRGCLVDEFTGIYVFNLRGNQRTSGELSRREGGKIFGSGSRAPIAITVLVKNPAQPTPAQLKYYDIGDYLTREEKLNVIRSFVSVNGLANATKWTALAPNAENDWINQRDPTFERFDVLGNKDDKENGDSVTYFGLYSLGVVTNRDAWIYNMSRNQVAKQISSMVDTYNKELRKYQEACEELGKSEWPGVEEVVDADPKRISWTRSLKADISRSKPLQYDSSSHVVCLYRPFTKQHMYFNRRLNEMVYQMPKCFPTPKHANIAISSTGVGATKEFSVIMTNTVIDLECISKGQCFPLYFYENAEPTGKLKFEEDDEIIDGYRRREAITDAILKKFREAYGPKVSKEDIFYYVYGILHSPEYRRRFAADLKKMLPRIPLTKEASDFKAFSKAGRNLAEWHLSYETIEPYKVKEQADSLNFDKDEQFKVQKMTFARPTAEQKARGEKWDKSRIIYNSHITLTGIPLEAYEYVVNGKPAIEWIMERYQVTRDKDSGITNDPNDWCKEHNQPRYIIDLVKRIIRVSLETMKIVKALPTLNEQK